MFFTHLTIACCMISRVTSGGVTIDSDAEITGRSASVAYATLTGDSYGLLPYNAYGELKNDDWRFAAGLQNDVFNPRKPNVISLAAMFTTGNTGSFRSQARIERFIKPSNASEYTLQVALSDPIQSVLGNRDMRIQEDNGWPNVEGRASMGIGPMEPLSGNRKTRPFELGSSAFVGQIRTTRSILAPSRSTIANKIYRGLLGLWN